jgi:hypothetical protein
MGTIKTTDEELIRQEKNLLEARADKIRYLRMVQAG